MTDSDEQPVPASYSRLLDRMAHPGERSAGAERAPAGASASARWQPEKRRGAQKTDPRMTERDGEHQAAAPRSSTAPEPPKAAELDAAGDLVGALAPPRRRDATEAVRLKLAPEQFHWLYLAAARAGGKVDQSTIVAAALRLLEFLDLDWRRIDSRLGLASALASAAARAGAWDTRIEAAPSGLPRPEGHEPSGRDPERPDRDDHEPGHPDPTIT